MYLQGDKSVILFPQHFRSLLIDVVEHILSVESNQNQVIVVLVLDHFVKHQTSKNTPVLTNADISLFKKGC